MSEAFSKILDFLAAWWRALIFWEILDVEERGFVRRLGKPARDLKPGLNLKWPLLEKACTINAQEGVYVLDPQSLRTRDGVDIVIRVSVTFRVVNARKFYLEAWGALENIRDLVAGEVGEAVRKSSAEDVYGAAALKLALTNARRRAADWGVAIVRLRCLDAAKGRSLRLWQTQTTATGET